jgi:hypothetical protein
MINGDVDINIDGLRGGCKVDEYRMSLRRRGGMGEVA